MATKKDPLFEKVLRDLTTEKKHPTIDKILVFLAGNGPCSKWQIAKVLSLSYGNTYATIKDLLQNELIRVIETRASGKNKKIEVEYYGLTLLGFIVALTAIEVKPENKALIVSVIEKQSHLHPLFAKWTTLMQQSQVSQIALFQSLKGTVGSICYEWKEGMNKHLVNEDYLTNYFSEKMLGMVQEISEVPVPYTRLDMWLEVIRQDKELKHYIEAKLKESIRKDHERLEYREKLLRKIED